MRRFLSDVGVANSDVGSCGQQQQPSDRRDQRQHPGSQSGAQSGQQQSDCECRVERADLVRDVDRRGVVVAEEQHRAGHEELNRREDGERDPDGQRAS